MQGCRCAVAWTESEEEEEESEEEEEEVTVTPLAGIKVLDLSTFLSGPLVTRALADLGADVIKVESQSGDPTRAGAGLKTGDPPSPFWISLHRDRRGVVLDLKSPEGRDVLLDLVGASDVLVEELPSRRHGATRPVPCSASPGQWASRALQHHRFRARRTLADQVYLDGAVQAFAGLVDLADRLGLSASPSPLTVADIAGGSVGTQGILAALLARERTGTGAHIEVSLFEALLQWLTLADRTGTLAPPITQVVVASDGRALLVQSPLHFQQRLVELVSEVPGFADLADKGFDTLEGVRANPQEYSLAMRRAFATRTADEWLELLLGKGIPASLLNSIDQAMSHPQLEHRHAVVDLELPDGGHTRVLASPYCFDGVRHTDTRLPPALGEDTEAVLRELLGYDRARIVHLAAAGAFGAGGLPR